MRSWSKAERAAIGLAVLSAHLALILLICNPSESPERETATETVVGLYYVAPIHESGRPLTRNGTNGRSSTALEESSASERRASPTRASQRRTPRAAVLARRQISRAPPVHAIERQEHPPAPIDWNLEAKQAAKQEVARQERARKQALGLTRRSGVSSAIVSALRPLPPPPPEFGWAQWRIHRIEAIKGAGLVIHLSERCGLIIAGLMLLPGCSLGKIDARGDLFAHMHDPTDPKALP